jgi:hypothetical protein
MLVVWFFTCCCAWPILAQTEPAVIAGEAVAYRHPLLDESFTAYEVVRLDYQGLYALSQHNEGRFAFLLSLASGRQWSIELNYHDLRAANYREVALTERGPQLLPRRPNITYRGATADQQGQVRFSITPDWCLGMIDVADGTYFLEPVAQMVEGAARDLYLLYEADQVLTDPAAHCSFNAVKKYALPEEPSTQRPKMACLEVELATAGDFGMFTRYGSVQAVNDFIITVTNNMEPLYDDFNLDYLIVDQFVPASEAADPWTDSDEAFDILNSFSAWAPGNLNGHDIGQIWVTRDIQGCGGGPDNFGLIGCAQEIGDVCGPERYNVCEDFSNSANCLRALSAHEIGHTFDGVHSQSDGSSIMTPSIQCGATYWAPGNITRMQDHIDSRDCLSACGTDCTIALGIIKTDESCPGANDGSVVATLSGANPTVTFELSGPLNTTSTVGLFTDLPDGAYTLRAIDGNFSETCWDEVGFTIQAGVDNTDPDLVCMNAVVILDGNGDGGIVATDVVDLGASSDNCGQLILNTPSPNTFDCSDIGASIMVTVTASDGNGNSGNCMAQVTVVDNEKPTLDCQSGFTQPNDAGLCGADVTLALPVNDDNCAVVFLKARVRPVDPQTNAPLGPWSPFMDDPSGYYEVGKYRVQWRAMDPSDNTTNCAFFFQVIDNEPPMAVCKDHTIDFNGEEEIVLQAADIWDEAASMDNCGPTFFVGADPPAIPCEDLGEIIPVTVTIQDQYGNTADCISLVTVDGLPCGWMTWDDHISCPGSSADYDVPTETFFLTSADCHHSPFSSFPEEYAYVKTELCGDGEIIAQVSDLTGLGKAWAGVVMRENNDPGSKKFQLMTGMNYLPHRVDWRSATDGTNQTQTFSRYNQHWLRIVRTGPIFQAYTSFDGVSWGAAVNTQVINMAACIEVGMVVTNVPFATNVTAAFNHVFVTPPAPPRPSQPLDDATTAALPSGISLYPNPAGQTAILDLTNYLDQGADLEIVNLMGQPLMRRSLGAIEQATLSLDLSPLPAGVYLLRLQFADGRQAQLKFVKA